MLDLFDAISPGLFEGKLTCIVEIVYMKSLDFIDSYEALVTF